MKTKRPLSIYIHIPFCVRKCLYCDFLSAPASGETMEAYASCLCREIEAAGKLYPDYEVRTVFFGGGTPSILKKERICQIMEALRRAFSLAEDAEITIEVNPGTVDADKLAAYYAAGINRLSIGVQSLQENELKALGRIHSTKEFFQTYSMAIKSGFNNINVDLMSAIPEQTLESCQDTLRQLLSLDRPPSHISAYSLIIEEGTPFYEKYEDHPELLPPEEEERQMYHDTKKILHEHGYERYEISNYARAGYACRHNLGYWERREYKGFGLGSASLLENRRYTNTCELKQYLQGRIRGTEEELSEQDIREETFFLGLRKMEGIDPGPYRAHYEKLLEKLQMQQLLEEKNGRISLTEYGIDISNYVLAQFLED